MASPTIRADETLKSLLQYSAGHPRVPWRYPRQEWPGKVCGVTDPNWAACLVTRESFIGNLPQAGKTNPFFAAS